MTTVLEEIQETKQIVQEQDYTIDEIIPKWSHLLDMMNVHNPSKEKIYYYKRRHGLDISTHSKCIAGEAYLFSNLYLSSSCKWCGVCHRYADNGLIDLYENVENGCYVGKDWRKSSTIRLFVQHWNRKHKEVTKQRI